MKERAHTSSEVLQKAHSRLNESATPRLRVVRSERTEG